MKKLLLCPLLAAMALAAPRQPARADAVANLTLPVLTVPFATATPLVSGAADDPAWARAAVIPSMVQSIDPGGKVTPCLPTEVRVLWDKDFLYVRFVCADNEIFTPHTKRDELHYQGDVAEIFLDAVGDGRLYYEFELSARNGVLDQYIALTAEPKTDQYGCLLDEIRVRDFWANLAWDCEGLRTATTVLQKDGHDTGWIADYALPADTVLKRLGQRKFAPCTIRANFLRYDHPLQANGKDRDFAAQNWSPVLYGSPHKSAARMGFLKLMDAPAARQPAPH